jgi:hypothetical protein
MDANTRHEFSIYMIAATGFAVVGLLAWMAL